LTNPPDGDAFFWDLRRYQEDKFFEEEEEDSSSMF